MNAARLRPGEAVGLGSGTTLAPDRMPSRSGDATGVLGERAVVGSLLGRPGESTIPEITSTSRTPAEQGPA